MKYRIDPQVQIGILFFRHYLKLIMLYKYHIEKDDRSNFLFECEYLYKNEAPATIEVENRINIRRDLILEDAVRDLYGQFNQRYDHVSSPTELLRILLANGYTLRAQNQPRLYKDYFQIKYVALRGTERIQIECFYFTPTDNHLDQLHSVAAWSDRLCGCPGFLKELIFKYMQAGFSIYADIGKLVPLIEVDTAENVISADDHIAKFLLK